MEHWADEFADLTAGEVQEIVEDAVERAAHYGFVRDVDVGRFVNLTVLLGDEFDEDPEMTWAAEILRNTALHPQHKLDLLLERGIAEVAALPDTPRAKAAHG
jgi:hypothetical protein